ncbi:hypothetical protein GC176_08560 [bacterium]|nr:hypothetical protein [bacterium]
MSAWLSTKACRVLAALLRIGWAVKRTVSWIRGFRRMRVRYDCKGTTLDAMTTMTAAVICFQMQYEPVA